MSDETCSSCGTKLRECTWCHITICPLCDEVRHGLGICGDSRRKY